MCMIKVNSKIKKKFAKLKFIDYSPLCLIHLSTNHFGDILTGVLFKERHSFPSAKTRSTFLLILAKSFVKQKQEYCVNFCCSRRRASCESCIQVLRWQRKFLFAKLHVAVMRIYTDIYLCMHICVLPTCLFSTNSELSFV